MRPNSGVGGVGGPRRPLKSKTFIVIRLFPLLRWRHKCVLHWTRSRYNWPGWAERVLKTWRKEQSRIENAQRAERIPDFDSTSCWRCETDNILLSGAQLKTGRLSEPRSCWLHLCSSPRQANAGEGGGREGGSCHLMNGEQLQRKERHRQSHPPKCSFFFSSNCPEIWHHLAFLLDCKNLHGDQWTEKQSFTETAGHSIQSWGYSWGEDGEEHKLGYNPGWQSLARWGTIWLRRTSPYDVQWWITSSEISRLVVESNSVNKKDRRGHSAECSAGHSWTFSHGLQKMKPSSGWITCSPGCLHEVLCEGF